MKYLYKVFCGGNLNASVADKFRIAGSAETLSRSFSLIPAHFRSFPLIPAHIPTVNQVHYFYHTTYLVDLIISIFLLFRLIVNDGG